MKRQIRRSIFETNSSSTHSICICTEEELDKWENGEFLYNTNTNKLEPVRQLNSWEKKKAEDEYTDSKTIFQKDWSDLSEDARAQWYRKYALDNDSNSWRFKTSDEYFNDSDLHSYTKHYTSPSGDKLVIFGLYGED